MKFILIAAVLLTGCAAKQIKVTYEPDQFGVPTPVVDGKRYPMTDEERRAIAQKFVNAYCS